MSHIESMFQNHPVLDEIRLERLAQDSKWGEQNHEPAFYLAILAEECAEAAKEVVEIDAILHNLAPSGPLGDRLQALRKELVQTAAVAVAFVQCIDRDLWGGR